jgi:hypothetical protein
MLEQENIEINQETIENEVSRLISLHNNPEDPNPMGTREELKIAIQASLITSNELVKVTGAPLWYRVHNHLKTLEDDYNK